MPHEFQGSPPGGPGFPQPGPPPPFNPAGGPPPPGLFDTISQLASRERPNALDKMRQVVDILEEVRELDPKVASVASMMIHLAKNGQKGLQDFSEDSPGRPPEPESGVRGVVGR